MNTGIKSLKGVKNCFEVAFSTDDVQRAFENAVSSGAKEINKPAEKPWGQIVAYVQDTFGTKIEICTPMGKFIKHITNHCTGLLLRLCCVKISEFKR